MLIEDRDNGNDTLKMRRRRAAQVCSERTSSPSSAARLSRRASFRPAVNCRRLWACTISALSIRQAAAATLHGGGRSSRPGHHPRRLCKRRPLFSPARKVDHRAVLGQPVAWRGESAVVFLELFAAGSLTSAAGIATQRYSWRRLSRSPLLSATTFIPRRWSGRGSTPSSRRDRKHEVRSRHGERFPRQGFGPRDLFDCLHDMGDPIGAARHVRQTLKPDGKCSSPPPP
jgi:hypothetical protein